MENRNKDYEGLESTLNILGLAGRGTHTLQVSKIFSRCLRAYWMTIISFLALGKLIPPHFVVPYTLLNMFGRGGHIDLLSEIFSKSVEAHWVTII